MAKRFTDTDKYKKPFIRGLPGPYKLLWDYLYHDCDHAGIWIVDFDIAQVYIGKDMPVTKEEALKVFNADPEDQKVIPIDNGKKWFIPSFISFQYGELNPQNRAHNSVLQILKKYNLSLTNKGLISPYQGCKDKERDKDKEYFGKSENLFLDEAREFYRKEFEKGKGDKSYNAYCRFVGIIFNEKFKNPLDKPAHHLIRIPGQVTFSQYKELSKEAKLRGVKILDLLDDMINKPTYTDGTESLYLTLLSWIKRRPIQGTNHSGDYKDLEIKTKIGQEK